ncbi:MAG TPA: aspartyl/asparaginyl beta-hydroxylase domain-containing protein [Solirubrobacteraceae bacterium]
MRDATRERIVGATVFVGERALWRIERLIGRASLVGEATFFDAASFAWTRKLEDGWPEIRAELDRVLEDRELLPNFQEISVDQASITNDDNWKTYFLYGYGFKSQANCARCPETARLCAEIPGMKTAFFSILSPGKHVEAHRGPYKGVLRYHLGLKIPEPVDGCRIRVDQDVRHWSEGGSLIFDDTYDHEAWNDTDGVRVVLFVDFVRPLRSPANIVNWLVLKAIAFSPFIGDAKRRQNDWEQRFESLKSRREPAGVA